MLRDEEGTGSRSTVIQSEVTLKVKLPLKHIKLYLIYLVWKSVNHAIGKMSNERDTITVLHTDHR